VFVSVIATVLNEEATIDALLDSLQRQTRAPDQVVIVDGGSNDGTLDKLYARAERARSWLTALSLPGSNISQGRNAAIAAAHGDIIVSTDAGVRLEDDWLEQITEPFTARPRPDVVSGFFVPDPQTPFEFALGHMTLPRLDEIDPARFDPSSRSVAFTRKAWASVGGYPEWLDYCEDLLFDFALRDAGYRFAFAPNAVVHFRPRTSLTSFFKQYYRYARGDGKADFWRYRHAIRYATYACVPVLVALAIAHHPAWWIVLGAGMLAILRRPLRRLGPALRDASLWEATRAMLWMPLIQFAGDMAKITGYPVGVWWRWHHAPAEVWSKRAF